jgi:glycosyltransferase involved in cell wall biosynthesis
LPELSAEPPWILFAADVPLAPATHGSRVRNVQLVEALRAAGFRVLYLYWERTPREGDVDAMRPLVDQLDVVRARRSTLRKRTLRLRRSIARTLGTTRSLPAGAWWWLVEDRDAEWLCPKSLRTHLEHLLATLNVAAVIASYANLAPLAGIAHDHGVLGIVDTLDVMLLRAATLRAQRIRPTGLLVPRETEARWLSQADIVIAIQHREALALADMLSDTQVLEIEHALTVPPDFDPTPAREPTLVLLGSNNRPNQHGLTWFLEHVWPLILREQPDAELLVFGPLSTTSACTGPRVRSMGSPAHVQTAYRAARLVINPVRAGAGLKIKTVEALAHSRALVTTGPGADGLEDAANTAFLLRDDPKAFAEACVAFLRDFEAARTLGNTAGEYARKRFAPERVYAPLIQAIRSHASAR